MGFSIALLQDLPTKIKIQGCGIMVSLKELDEALKVNAEKNNNYIMQIATELISCIAEKDNTILSLQAELDQLKTKLKSMGDQYRVSQDTISRLINDQNATKVIENNKLLLIMSPQDAFEHSKEIGLEYLSKVDWSVISFNHAIDIINATLRSNDIDLVDEAIICIVDNKLKSLSRDQFDALLKALKAYVEMHNEKDTYSANGLFYFFNKVDELGWTELLKLFVSETIQQISQIVTRAAEKQLRCRNAILLLKILFLLDESSAWIKCLKEFYLKRVFGGKLELNQALELVYMSMYYKADSAIIDRVSAVREALGYDIPEIACYRVYYEGIQNPKQIEAAAKEIKELEKQCNTLNTRVRAKVFKRMFAYMNKEQKNYLQSIRQEQVEKRLDNALYMQDMNLPTAMAVHLIQKKAVKCLAECGELTWIDCNLAFYESNKSQEVKGYIKHKVLYCKVCQRFFINSDIQDTIIPLLGTNKLKKLTNNIKKPDRNIEQNRISPLMKINHYSTFNSFSNNNEGSGNSSIDLKNTKEKSDLYELGYSLKLTKQQRWDIIQRLAIPKLGARWIVDHLENLISWRSTQRAHDFRSAIMEWQYDVNRIKQNYKV